jgi:hypothetical protein
MLKHISQLAGRWIPVRYEPQTRVGPADFLLALLLGLLAAAMSIRASGQIDPAIYELRGINVWFDADHPRFLAAITDPDSARQAHTERHPLFVLLTSPATRVLTEFGVAPHKVMRWMISGCASAAVVFLFFALKGLGLPIAVAALFSGVYLASATFIHWFSIFETYPFAAASMSLMLMVLTCASESRWLLWIIASSAALSVTITNWTLALASALFRHGLKKAIAISVATLFAVSLLALMQKSYYPTSQLFFNPNYLARHVRLVSREMERTSATVQALASKLLSVTVASAVAPKPEKMATYRGKIPWKIVANQYSPLSSHAMSGWIALASWMVLLSVGGIGGWRNVERRSIFFAISLFLIGQIVLHSVFGEHTFLYAANFFGAFVMFAAFGWFSRLRICAVMAAIVFVVFGSLSNYMQFEAAARLANSIVRY